LEKNPTTDAVICLADVTATAVIHQLKMLGKAEKILVTGFDNLEIAEYNGITTVDQQLSVTGERAMANLHQALSSGKLPKAPAIWYISTTFIQRMPDYSGADQTPAP
jgi:DNA-binding LacI/PurR family transcriptional regulator